MKAFYRRFPQRLAKTPIRAGGGVVSSTSGGAPSTCDRHGHPSGLRHLVRVVQHLEEAELWQVGCAGNVCTLLAKPAPAFQSVGYWRLD